MKNPNLNVKVNPKSLLLVLLAVAVAVIPLVFLVIPEVNNSKAALAQAQAAQEDEQVMRTTISNLPQKQEEYLGMEAEALISQIAIPTRQKSYDIDVYLRQIIQGAGATITNMNIGEYEDVSEEFLEEIATRLMEKMEDGARVYPKLQFVSSVSLSIEGDLQTILNAFDAIEKAGKNILLYNFNLQVQALGGDQAIVAVPVDAEDTTVDATTGDTATTDTVATPQDVATPQISPREVRTATIQLYIFAADIPTEPVATPTPDAETAPAPSASAAIA